MFEILAVGAGGFIGSVGRYLVIKLFEKLALGFPLATLCVNALASFVLGLILGFIALDGVISERLRLFLVVGILGGFSTFSAFSGETLTFIREGAYLLATLNAVLNVGISVGAAALGFALSSFVTTSGVQ